MNIFELDSYNLADTVKFHDRLNPRLWDRGEHLRPDVHAKLMEIARDFQEFLGVPDLDVKDITVSGSNAAYNYTPQSDIDLHLVVDLPEADHSEVYRELFDAKKFQYNETHNIKIGGYDVELYVQNPNQEHHSQGIYSLLRNAWIRVPRRRKAEIDDISTRSKYEDLAARIDSTVSSGNHDSMANLMKKIKGMRQSGLEQQGEFGSDNLAFKLLRNNGYIKKLVDAKNAARDRELSLAELSKPKQRVTYGFSENYKSYFKAPEKPVEEPKEKVFRNANEYEWFKLQQKKQPEKQPTKESPDGVDPTTKMFLEDPVAESPDGVNPSTAMFVTEDDNEITVRNFIDFVAGRLGIEDMPTIELHTDPNWSRENKSFGRYTPETHTLEVNLANRHIMDILRTTAHELVHCRQNQESQLPSEAGETGSRWENQAHAIAGVIMRDYADHNPRMFESSGYIPTDAEKNDPRFLMALSPDVRPGATGLNANRLKLQTDAQGRPKLLMKTANLRESITPKMIHALADRKGVAWDNDPSFLAKTKKLTGKEHLDDLDSKGLNRVQAWLDSKPDVEQQQVRETAEELQELSQFSKIVADYLKQTWSQYIQNPQTAEYVKQQMSEPMSDGSTFKNLMPTVSLNSVPGAESFNSPGLQLAKKFTSIVIGYFPKPGGDNYYGFSEAAPAVYDPQSRTVVINKDYLSDPDELTRAVAHEVQHGIDDLKSRKGLSVNTDQQDVDLSYYDQGKAFQYKQSAGNASAQQKYQSYLAMPHEVNARFTEVVNDLKQHIEQLDIRNIDSKGLADMARSAFALHYMHEVFPNGAKDPGYKRLLSRVYAWLSKYYKDRLASGPVVKDEPAVEIAETTELAESLRQELQLFEQQNVAEYRMPQPSQGQGKYRDLNEPLGPETPPTMPAGTVKVDVSDVYDWYKLGQHISNLKGLGKHDFGAGPPSTIISFGDEETEHKYIKDLEKTGLTTTDIDPKDPNQPPGMKRQKTDPTYNVAENKITLSTDPNWYGAEVGDYKATGPVVDIPANKLVGFEPDDKMNQSKSKDNVEKIVAGLEKGDKLPPILVRKYKNGYQVLDGHHRFWAYKLAGIKSIPAQIVPAKDIEEKGKKDITKDLAESLLQELQVFEDQDLLEIKMTGKNLSKLAAEIPGATVGLEFEMIVPNTDSPGNEDLEPDYDQDERVRDIDDAVNFFDDGDYNGRGDIRRLRESMESDYQDWVMEQIDEEWFGGNGMEFFQEFLDREYPFDRDDAFEEARDEIITANPDLPQDSEELQQLISARVDEMEASYYVDQWEEQGSYYDYAREEFEDEQRDSLSELDWLNSQSIRFASDVHTQYPVVSWPYWTSPGGDDTDVKQVALEFMNFMGYDTIAVGDYHGYGGGYELWNGSEWRKIGSNKPMDAFTVEPDGSLSGDDAGDTGLEFVSPPIPLAEIGNTMAKVQAWAAQNGVYTGKSNGTALHTNISIPGYSIDNLDYLKAALLLGDEHVLRDFGRITNTYAKPAIAKVKELVRNKPEKAQELLNKMKSQLNAEASKLIHSGSTDKYTSINTKDNRIEFRSPGGDYLSIIADNPQKMVDTINRMVVTLDAAMDPNKYKEEYQKKLYKLLTGQTFGRETQTGAKQEMKQDDKDLLNIFSRYAAGELPKAALKSFVRQAQLQRSVSKGKTGDQKMWWKVSNPAQSFASVEVVASTKEEAIKQALGPDGYPSWANTRNTVVAEPLRPYEEKPAQSGTDTSQTDMENRLGWPDQTGDANYEIVDRQTNRPVFLFIANTEADAWRKYSDWLTAAGIPEDTEDYGWRPRGARGQHAQSHLRFDQSQVDYEIYNRETGEVVDTAQLRNDNEAMIRLNDYQNHGPHSLNREQADRMFGIRRAPIPGSTLDLQRQRAAQAQQIPEVPLDIEIAPRQTNSLPGGPNYTVVNDPRDAAQGGIVDVAGEQPAQGSFTGEWKVVDSQGRELYRFGGVGNSQADANRVAAQWAQRNMVRDEVSVVPVMG